MTKIETLTLDESTKELTVGQSEFLHATVSPSDATNQAIAWTSSDENVATVTPSGMVMAQGEGAATIYARTTDSSEQVASCSVSVASEVKITKIELCPPDKTVTEDVGVYMIPTICPSNATNKTLQWSYQRIDGGNITLVPDAYLAIPKKCGKVIVTAKATDGSGKYATCEITILARSPDPRLAWREDISGFGMVDDPVDIYSGAHVITNDVMKLYGGQGITLTAKYNSLSLMDGSLGIGWYHNYDKWVYEDPCGNMRVYTGTSTYDDYEYVSSTMYKCKAPDKNITLQKIGGYYSYIVDYGDEIFEYYGEGGKLIQISNRQGFNISICYSDTTTTITDSITGKSIYIEKNSNGKITRVYDDAQRQVTFTYSGNYLVGICDVNGKTISYTYTADGQIKTGTDSEQIVFFKNTYDNYGRVKTQKDGIAGSTASIFEYTDEHTRKHTNRNGKQTIRVYNDNGLLTSYTDENGNTTYYTYDSRYNIIRETDALGNYIQKEYDLNNKITKIIDKNGNTTWYDRDTFGNIIAIRYPEVDGVIPQETFTYNFDYQLESHTDLRGTVTQYTYDINKMPLTKKVGDKTAEQYVYENGLLKSKTDAKGNTTSYTYNTIGQMVSSTDAQNNTTQYSYDAAGNVLQITDAENNTVVNTYDGNGQKKTVKDANGNITSYTYNGNMKNTVITLPDNSIIRYEYDGEDRQVKMIDQLNNIVVTGYDDAGRIISKTFPDGSSVQYEYDAVGNVISETNPKGAVTFKTYDANSNVLSVTDNDGNITRYDYDTLSRMVRKVNAVSGSVVYEYSLAGDLLSETNELGHKKTYTYDAYGNKLSQTDAKGNTAYYTYDANNNLLTDTDVLGNVTTYTYDSLNRLVSVKDANNYTVTYGYDALGRRTTVTDARNNVFTTVYDGNGNVVMTVDAKGKTVRQTVYNSLNLASSVTDAAGKTTSYTYNALGKVNTVTDPFNNSHSYTYDSRGNNTAVTDALNGQSSAQYDAMGNITRLAGPLGGATNYTYDEMGRCISETTASGGTVTYGYNELNVKKQLTNARGQTREYFYDAAGRITGYVGAEDSVSYTYDENGNVLTVSDKNGTVKREYDALNRITKYTDTFGNEIDYMYDRVGNMVRLIYPDNTEVYYMYDGNRNLVAVIDWNSIDTNYTYDENNNLIRMSRSDGAYATTVYDDAQRVISREEYNRCGQRILAYSYEYDSLGRIITEIHLVNNIKFCYTYDELSRVMKRTTKNMCDEIISEESFAYDAAGNLTGAPSSSFVYDTNNRLTTFNCFPITYDADGNMICNTAMAFEYDSANRLINAGGQKYTYNAEDVRICKYDGTTNTKYLYDTNCRLSRLLMKTTNGVVTKYLYGVDLIGEQTSNGFKTYHYDNRGSVVAMVDAYGIVTDTFEYDTYGKVTQHIGSSDTIFRYNGRDGVVTDENGLIYMRARYYSPAMRRFINADIIPGELSNAITLNRYAYANGNPVSNVDPFGLSAERGGIEGISKKYDVSFEHARIIYYSNQWKNISHVKWTNWDIIKWKTFSGNDYLFEKKKEYINNYKDVIYDAAEKYNIPVFLLAGVAFTEFGGDPMWIDDVAYGVRSFDWSGPDWVDEKLTITKNPDYTSFGNTSIQVRRALEMLNYTADAQQKGNVIDALKDPIQNIYMAARHLDVLRNVDFFGKSAEQLTDSEIQTIASRYNLGPDVSYDKASNWSYGKSIFNNEDMILEALG